MFAAMCCSCHTEKSHRGGARAWQPVNCFVRRTDTGSHAALKTITWSLGQTMGMCGSEDQSCDWHPQTEARPRVEDHNCAGTSIRGYLRTGCGWGSPSWQVEHILDLRWTRVRRSVGESRLSSGETAWYCEGCECRRTMSLFFFLSIPSPWSRFSACWRAPTHGRESTSTLWCGAAAAIAGGLLSRRAPVRADVDRAGTITAGTA